MYLDTASLYVTAAAPGASVSAAGATITSSTCNLHAGHVKSSNRRILRKHNAHGSSAHEQFVTQRRCGYCMGFVHTMHTGASMVVERSGRELYRRGLDVFCDLEER